MRNLPIPLRWVISVVLFLLYTWLAGLLAIRIVKGLILWYSPNATWLEFVQNLSVVSGSILFTLTIFVCALVYVGFSYVASFCPQPKIVYVIALTLVSVFFLVNITVAARLHYLSFNLACVIGGLAVTVVGLSFALKNQK